MRPLQRHFHSPDKPVYATVSTIPFSPFHPTQAIVSYVRFPYPTFPAGVHDFHLRLYPELGAHMGDFQIAGVWTRSERRFHINVLEIKAVIMIFPNWVAVLQGHHVLIATDNNTVVAYINKQGVNHSHALLRLVVGLFLWLQTQDITLRARHIPCCLNVIADRLSRPNQPITTELSLYPEVVNLIFRLWGTPVVDIFATVHNTHLPQFVSPVPEPRALGIDALSQDWQWRSMYMFLSFPCSTESLRSSGPLI